MAVSIEKMDIRSFPKSTLDQWRSFVAVVDFGGYAKAAEHLRKSQSALTYAVQKLERQMGVKAFEIQGRKAVLTSAGQVLYQRGRILLEQAVRLERAAAGMAAGWEADLRIVVDTIFPACLLLRSLAQFADERPDTRIELMESFLGGTDSALLDGWANLAIGSSVPPGFLGDALMHVRFIAAAHPNHALHRMARPLTLEDLAQHRSLMVRDYGQDFQQPPASLVEQRLTVSHASTSIQAACLGLGYAWFAEDIISEELARGILKPLPLVEGGDRWLTLYLIFADRDTAGPCVLRIAELIRQSVSDRYPAAQID